MSDRIGDFYPDHPLSYITKALIYGYKIIYKVDAENARADQVLDDIDQAISLEENAKNKAKYFHFKSFILKQLEEFEEALEAHANGTAFKIVTLNPEEIDEVELDQANKME